MSDTCRNHDERKYDERRLGIVIDLMEWKTRLLLEGRLDEVLRECSPFNYRPAVNIPGDSKDNRRFISPEEIRENAKRHRNTSRPSAKGVNGIRW